MKYFFYIFTLIFALSSTYGQDKFILETSTKPRFELTDKVWPQTIGNASVCLWNDDKLSAFTITIDDNNEQDIPYWIKLQQKYGFKFTWFITTEADKSFNVKNWNVFNQLFKAGNAIQGHDDRNWFEDKEKGVKYPSLKAYNKRLKKTITTIEKHVPNNKCLTYAYPWGEGNVEEVAKHFIASRGVIGLLNPANRINFKQVRSISNPHIYLNDSTRNRYILPLLDKTSKLEKQNYYRGWGSTHFHHITSPEAQKTTDDFLYYLKQKEDKLWITTFPNVAKYAQQYATHTLKVDSISDTFISFNLTDKMSNHIYNFPLTVKVRLANNWTSLSATQNEKTLEHKIISYNTNKYALVKATPDRGKVVLKGTVDKNLQKNNFSSRFELSTLTDDYHLPTTISNEAQELLKKRKRTAKFNASFPSADAPLKDWIKLQKEVDSTILKGLNPIKKHYKALIDTITIGTIRAIDIKPKSYKKSDNVIVYVHGGAYVLLSADVTLASMLPLAEATGLRIIAIDYTLAPKANFKQITEEVINFYNGLLEQYNPKNIAMYGDSAGGGLLAGSVLKMRDLGMPLPAVLVLWSPWTDIDQIGDTYSTLADNDPSLKYPNFLENAAKAYASKEEFKNPYVSPVYGDYSKAYPPTLIQVGGKEVFLSNAIRMYRALNDFDKEVKLDVYEGMWHVWQGHYLLPESKKAVKNTKKFMFKYLNIN